MKKHHDNYFLLFYSSSTDMDNEWKRHDVVKTAVHFSVAMPLFVTILESGENVF